ncbi:polyprenyl synthetase family protein [Acuticoccus sp. I52.16.1]|uniref:polyprenyl synthetase family protein n=1 Tax=Acuticoccus sp. I52.16.1 TaxID=2928472 RepID=UPI001FD05889|nr:farnesyl diphosphate synthase [Acuticoccus sp. I52.16.1]UOM36102.1 polyprenyl synthetase family protein [Acuticoccus sp. I52.16.1]
MDFAARLAAAAEATNRVLDETLQPTSSIPGRLQDATRYATLAGGKRFRPFLVLEAAALFGADVAAAEHVGAAFECLHSYSLVHDDLPAMDDDDLRRGQPTVHKAYDEATAILVGDGLQALAFEIITGPPVPPDLAGPLAHLLARASGNAGMVGGQYRDLNALGLDADGIRDMQAMKTGRLIVAACEAGAVLGRAEAAERRALVRYGTLLGEAFQLADDLLDVEGTAEETGKKVGKDAAADKATLVGLIGPQAARQRLTEIVAAASEALAPFGGRASPLREACRFVAERRS